MPQNGYQRVSPGVYRSPTGQLTNSQWRPMPGQQQRPPMQQMPMQQQLGQQMLGQQPWGYQQGPNGMNFSRGPQGLEQLPPQGLRGFAGGQIDPMRYPGAMQNMAPVQNGQSMGQFMPMQRYAPYSGAPNTMRGPARGLLSKPPVG